MIKRAFIYEAHRNQGIPKGTLSRHAKDSANILSRVSRVLSEHPAPHKLDLKWPFHLVVYMNGQKISIYAAGWDKSIDVLPLKADGSTYNAKYERRFLTPKGVVNYILKKYGKPRILKE